MANIDSQPTHDEWIRAGNIAAQTLAHGKALIKKGNSLLSVADACDAKIRELGAIPAFPSQISCDDIAAHYCPDDTDKTVFDSQLVSLDVGACLNGAIGDNATTVDLSGNYTDLVKASQDALRSAIAIAQIGTSVGEIGKAIQDAIQSHGFSPVRNLSGHGLGVYNIHDTPSIPNISTDDTVELKEGMFIAIEPFASAGKGVIYESSPATIFALTNKKPVRNPFARKILDDIEQFKGLPFTTRWLTRKHGDLKTSIGLRELKKVGSITEYPPLPDMDHGMIAQSEHSLYIGDKVIITTKHDE